MEGLFLEEFKQVQVYTKVLLCEISLVLKMINYEWWKSNSKIEHSDYWDLKSNSSRKLVKNFVQLKGFIQVLQATLLFNL